MCYEFKIIIFFWLDITNSRDIEDMGAYHKVSSIHLTIFFGKTKLHFGPGMIKSVFDSYS